MKLVVISNPTATENEHEVLNAMFENGLEYFHLRKPACNSEELHCYLNEIPEKYHSRIIVHYHFGLLDKFNLKGIHFNAGNFQLRANFSGLHFSYSAHSLSESLEVSSEVNYAFLSPVFDSISKPGYTGAFEPKTIRDFLKTNQLNAKVIALGGIQKDKIGICREIGFAGVAILGLIWNNKPDVAIKNYFEISNLVL
ncbi:MAG: thiamine phosphate synthase [Bacteroidetes bacterium]|nr:thiamine phosphate synthase [Bacteroidota bacterium]MBU1720448.1 thiamine phosphate synthase [Bacteroidota bacterium]